VQPPYPHVRVEGRPRQRGRQYGEQAAERIGRSLSAYTGVFLHYAGWDWPTVLEQARRFEAPIAAYDQRYLDEIAGIAQGAGVAYEAVLALNVRTEMMFSAGARLQARGRKAVECSSFAVLPGASASGHTIVGQNWDWLVHCAGTVVVVEARADDGPRYVTVVEAGLLAKTGLNSAGIGLATNGLVTDLDVGAAGVPYHVILRAILDARTIGDALAAIERKPRACSANYLICDDRGSAIDVEAAPGGASRVRRIASGGGILVHTNHFLSPIPGARDISSVAMPNTDSHFRHVRLRDTLAGLHGSLSPQVLERLLGDHANHPFSVCCHPSTAMGPHERVATVASVIMDLDARRMWLADGHPCTAPYRDVGSAAFLSG
jgi:isopenicillin-N N-acyltransferase-like protein